jgi:hypothetical protein
MRASYGKLVNGRLILRQILAVCLSDIRHLVITCAQLADLPNCWWEIPPTCPLMNQLAPEIGGNLQLARLLN